MTLLSIIIPVLNESPALAAQLPDLQVLRAAGHELIVVDGGSSDDSVRQCQGRVDHLLHAGAGRALQMNAGAAVAAGEILMFLHIDTVLRPSAVQAMLDALRQTGRQWGRFDVRLSGTHPALRVIGFMMNWRSRLSGIATGDQAIFVRRDTFWSAGGFPVVPLMEDVMISRTLKRHGRPLCLRERVISSSRRWEQHGIVRTVWLMWRLRLAFFFGADPALLHRRYYRHPPGRHPPGRHPPGRHPPGLHPPGRYPHGPANTRLLLFARTPVPGRVKTRLQPLLGEAGALALHQALIRYCWQQLAGSGLGEPELWVSEPGQALFFDGISIPAQRYLQQGEDLGVRMHGATCDALQRGSTVVITGADCPAVDASYIQSALQCLQDGADVVLGPAEDGGYVLVGMRAPHAVMFRDIEWGTDRVLLQTRQRLRDAGLHWQELEICWDVDRPEDLQRLAGLPIDLPIELPDEV